MVRRAATRINDGALGFVVGQLIKTDSNENQTLVFVYECSSTNLVTEEPMANVKYTDGSPAQVPVI